MMRMRTYMQALLATGDREISLASFTKDLCNTKQTLVVYLLLFKTNQFS